jgi:hypothetical protein
MPVLNPPSGLPAELVAIIKVLLNADPDGLPATELYRLISPVSLHSNASPEATIAESDTYKAARSVGIIEDRSGRLALAPLAAKGLGRKPTPQLLRTVVRRFFLRPVTGEDALTSNAGGYDLARAGAWFLLQDPWNPPFGWDGERGLQSTRLAQLPAELPLLENNARAGALERWLPFLGLAIHDYRGREILVPDPTDAVRAELRVITHGSGPKALTQLVQELGRVCPVLDSGVFQLAILSQLRRGALPTQSADALSRSLSHALLRLVDDGSIKLFNLADATKKVSLSTREGPVPYSHVEWQDG